MKKINVHSNITCKDTINLLNKKFNKKNEITKLVIFDVIAYFLAFSNMIINKLLSIRDILFLATLWIIISIKTNNNYLNKKSSKYNKKLNESLDSAKEIINELEKQNVYTNIDSFENATIISNKEKIKFSGDTTKLKESKIINDIYLLDKNDQIKIIREIKTYLKENKNINNTTEINLLNEEETNDEIKKNIIYKKLIIKPNENDK